MSQPNAPESLTFTVSVSHEYDGERRLPAPETVLFAITPSLADVLARAVAVNKKDSTPVSFTSLLIGMLTGDDDFSDWLKGELSLHGVAAARIAQRRTLPYDEQQIRAASFDPSKAFADPGMVFAASKSGYEALSEARAIAEALGSGPTIDVRHVGAAYPILPNWHVADFSELGIDRLAWCRRLGVYMARTFPTEKQYWREYADRASPVPLTSFSADTYSEKDLLGIDRSVDALALLIASTRTDTPLSIGVFGPWGSGKSFFMRHLRSRIYGLAQREQNRVSVWREARKNGTATSEQAPLYFGQVAQVEFNAWHYNEGNLVASLVDHLFRNLRVLPDKQDKELEQRRAQVIATISEAEGQAIESSSALEQTQTSVKTAEDAVQLAREEAASARRDVDVKRQELDATTVAAATARSRLDAAIKNVSAAATTVDPGAVATVALSPIADAAVLGEARKAADELVKTVADWRGFLSQVFTLRGAVVIALCLIAPLAAWLADWLTAQWASAAGVLTAVGASLSQVFAFVRERRQQFEAKLKELEREEQLKRDARRAVLEKERADLQATWQSKLDELRAGLEQQRAALTQQEEAVSAAVRSLAQRTKDLDEKVQQRASAEAKLRDAKAELKRLSSAVLLDEFIKDRASADEYQKRLSLLALVRRDFERLSALIASANADWCSPDKDSDPPLLNRIVLYIDDLDRCNVETVLKVLEAVHLLLAFPLFVCVVAVDPRWIEKCLREKHQQLFVDESVESVAPSSEDRAYVTVGDYLEKIFQIPIWMSPIEDRQRAAVVKSLLGATASPSHGNGRARGVPALREETRDPEGGEATAAGSASNAFQSIVNKAAETPDPLRITKEESAFVDLVAPLLSEKPRALKRFVNTYRLLKASLPDIDRDTFVVASASSPHKICISQLALFTGNPRLAATLVRRLARTGEAGPNLQDWLNQIDQAERAQIEKVVEQIPDYKTMSLKDFREWLPDTSKYPFHRDDQPR